MATELDLVELTRPQVTDKQVLESNTSSQPLPLQSISRFFKQNRGKDYASDNERYKRLQGAIQRHDMEFIKKELLCNCPLQVDARCFKSADNTSLPQYERSVSSIPSRDEDLLCLAATYGRTDIVHILLSRLRHDNVEPEELFDLTYSLHQACKLNNKSIVEALLKAGATPWEKDGDGFSAMHHAAFSGSLEVMRLLMENNGSIYVRTNDGRTPLHLAARKGYVPLVEFLLCNKASADIRDNNNATPLHYACISGVDNVVLLLLRGNCPVDETDCDGKTGLYIAAEKGRSSIIPILVSFGASIDKRCCPIYSTPLMAASIHGHVLAILELITNGASFHSTDSKRNSALELALLNKCDCAAALLMLREEPYSDYVHEFIRTQEYGLCKVVKSKLVQSLAALLDRMVIPEEGSTSYVRVMLRYLDTDISNKLPGEKGFIHSNPYFIKLIADNRLEDLAYHGTVRLYVKQQMNRFGRYFLLYKTILFFLFLLSMFVSFVTVATLQKPNNYMGFMEFRSVVRLLAELYVIAFWFSNVVTEVTEILTIMHRTILYLKLKRETKEKQATKEQTDLQYANDADSSNRDPQEDSLPGAETEDYSPVTPVRSRVDPHLRDRAIWNRIVHWSANIFLTRFLMEYFSDNFNWFDQSGLISLFITFILRAVSSPLQWILMPITFVLNCLRFFKLFNVYYSFGTYIRILASVTFYEIPPFILFFFWTLFVFSGAYFVSLRTPLYWLCSSNGTGAMECPLDPLNSSMDLEGYDDRVWYVALLGLRVLLEQGPVYPDNYIVRINWLSAFIFLVFLFITSVIYLNLLIAQLTDRYSKVKKVALKVVAWYRLNFIIQLQDTSLIARFYKFRQNHRTESITISASTLNKYYGVDGIDEFVERGSGGYRAYLPNVDTEQLLQYQKFSSRSHELHQKNLLAEVSQLKGQIANNNNRFDKLTEQLNTKMDDVTRLLTALLEKSQISDK